jgi:hypothetical protein
MIEPIDPGETKETEDMKKGFLLAALAALMIAPATAFAKGGPGGPGGPGKGAPKVMYVLRGTLSNYTPYTNSIYGSQNGSITITVSGANHHGKALKGQVLTFPVDGKTKISLATGVSAIANGDRGIVKIKAPKKIAAANLASTLQGIAAFQIVDQGPKS